jgi:hypothetical protein
MSCGPTPDRVAAVDGSRAPGGTTRAGDADGREAGLFLVEFSASQVTDDAADLHHALRYAVRRLAATGAVIRWCSGLLVPAEHRCLFLVEAGGRHVVVRARDSAGLSGARVAQVCPLPDRPLPSRTSGTEGRS